MQSHHSFNMFEHTLDALEANLAVIDENGCIVFTNRGWRTFAKRNPLKGGAPPRNTGLNANYLSICEAAIGSSSGDAMLIRDGIRAVLDGKRRKFSHEYPCHSPTIQRWFLMSASPLPRSSPRLVVVAHIDITARYLSEQRIQKKQRVLEAAFLQLQNVANGTKNALRDTEQATAASKISVEVPRGFGSDGKLNKLSARELEVFWGLVRGERNSSIADRLKLSRKSITTYRSRIFEKLKVENIAELVTLANRLDPNALGER